MKLNFWQILGLCLMIIAIVLIARRRTSDPVTTRPTGAAVESPATAPATAPATNPAAP